MNTKNLSKKIEETAEIMRAHHNDITVHTFLLLDSAAFVVNRYVELNSTKKNFSQSAFKVLNMLILQGGSMTPTELSNRVFRSKHSISKVTFTLEKHGLVKILPVDGDRRKKEVRITAKGLELAKSGNIFTREQRSHEVLGVLSDKEKKFMHDILERVRSHTLDLIGDESY